MLCKKTQINVKARLGTNQFETYCSSINYKYQIVVDDLTFCDTMDKPVIIVLDKLFSSNFFGARPSGNDDNSPWMRYPQSLIKQITNGAGYKENDIIMISTVINLFWFTGDPLPMHSKMIDFEFVIGA
jgi:hypothetical protein